MKRRSFFTSLGLVTAAAAAPSIVKAQKEEPFAHVPRDYMDIPEEPEEFQELDEALTPEQDRMDIIWE